MLGGTEVFRHGDFQGDPVQNTLLADQEILRERASCRSADDRRAQSRDGDQRLDVRFIQFDNVVIELLQYRNASEPMAALNALCRPPVRMSPALPAHDAHLLPHCATMSTSTGFITDLEAESARRGMTQVRANRIIRVRSEAERKAAPESSNTNKVTVAPSDG